MRPEATDAAMAEVKGRVLRSGTKLRAAYSLAAAAGDDGGRSVRVRRRPGLPELICAPGGALGGPVAHRAGSHRRCDQPAGAGVSAVPVGGWANALSGAVPADGAGRVVVYVLARAKGLRPDSHRRHPRKAGPFGLPRGRSETGADGSVDELLIEVDALDEVGERLLGGAGLGL